MSANDTESGTGYDANSGTRFWPVEIRLKKEEKCLEIEFDNGRRFSYAAEFLRVLSPSAEVQGHSPEQRQTIGGRMYVGILDIEPIGNYAIRLIFDDLHDSGIYTWTYLYGLGERQNEYWNGYLEELTAKGMSRDPRA